MKEDFFEMLAKNSKVSSRINCTVTTDFEICDTVQQIIKRSRFALGDECCNLMENSYRGLSHLMQLIMLHRITSFIIYGNYSSTGVKHVDDLIEAIIKAIPKAVIECAEIKRSKALAQKQLISENELIN